ncbi:MAG: hypothetical protein JRI68_11495 [Deltaproteobacteria bacterium]|nr:hypothetical protein [Deltaproteobacteria bacterium]
MAAKRPNPSSLLLAVTMLLVGGCSDDPVGGVVGGSTAAGGGSTAAGGGGTGGVGGQGGSGGTGATGGQGGTLPETTLIHSIGRFDESDPTAPTSSWSGRAFHTRVDGTSLLVELDGPARVYFQVIVDGAIDSQFVTVDGWGCDYHPSTTTHQKLGQQLATAMQAELGW